MTTTSIVIADDHPIVLAAIREIVEQDPRLKLVGTANSSTELVEVVASLRPDIVVTDYNMPGDDEIGDGIRMISYLLRRFPDSKVLVVTMVTNPAIIAALFKEGVHAVALKTGDRGEIREALSALLASRIYRPALLRDMGDDPQTGQNAGDRNKNLSPRELEVLRLYVQGQSVGDIAKYLNRSHKTVSTQKSSAMRKLGAHTDQELIEYCLSTNLFG